jgi:acyl-coenzyme A thioesterase PaaI-like protein
MISKRKLLRFLNFWPPFMGAGISVDYIATDFTEIDVSMKLKFWNKNYVNTQFGGSLYSMTDPFFMLMLMEQLGPNYIVWDKSASIDFKRPGRGKVYAKFLLDKETVDKIIKDLETTDKIYPVFEVNVLNSAKEIVCTVQKTLYVKKK